ncbi:MAG: hypothetical protein IJA98_01400 [Bacteroidaceae bacterium]|nr:hypothetical protein [Bacteroidaceae bacterium]MBQ7966989.1 hypothetical protein [Bacteroidaceae bacterium]
MNKRLSLTTMLAIISFVSLVAQTTALVPYVGGYFVKNGDEWTEYRPADKVGKWSTYKQYKENDIFFYVKNKKCNLAIPKLGKDMIFIDREKNGKWEQVYTTIDVHHQCTEPDGLFYCYNDGRGREHNGYFVRLDGGVWHEYAPGKKRGVWAEFKQTGEDKDYFIVESTENIVRIPKREGLNFIITKPGYDGWRGGYTTKAIYDRSAAYLYHFDFEYHGAAKRGNNFKLNKKGGRISLDNKCNLQIAFGGKHYDFVYQSIEIVEGQGGLSSLVSKGSECILITIDKDNRVMLYDGSARVESKRIGEKVLLVGASGKDCRAIIEQLRIGTFRM